MKTKIKLCGLRRPEDIAHANRVLPDYIGFVFAESRRFLHPDEAVRLKAALDPRIQTVGVFVNETVDAMVQITQQVGLDVLQLHGDEDTDTLLVLHERLPGIELWKAVRVSCVQDILNADDLPVSKLVLDARSAHAYGGTGEVADWDVVQMAKPIITKPFFLAGGLCAGNLRDALRLIEPYGVDLSSGIETDGVKDPSKIDEVMRIVRGS